MTVARGLASSGLVANSAATGVVAAWPVGLIDMARGDCFGLNTIEGVGFGCATLGTVVSWAGDWA